MPIRRHLSTTIEGSPSWQQIWRCHSRDHYKTKHNVPSLEEIQARSAFRILKCYYDQKITFIFSSDFETMFIKHSASEIISLNFEKKTVNLNCNFPF